MSFNYTTAIVEHKVHVHLDNCSINILRTDEGWVIDAWEKNFEGAEAIVSTWVLHTELEEVQAGC